VTPQAQSIADEAFAGAVSHRTHARRYVVACLAGNGIGPEVMAEASRALAQVSRLHGFAVEEVHPPFGGEAVTRSGHPLPTATRLATVGADAVLVAGASEPALEGIKAALDLAARVSRVLVAGGADLTLFTPLDESTADWTIEQAFASARAAHGRLVSVGVNGAWRSRVDLAANRHDGVEVLHLPLAQALQALTTAPSALGVVVTESVLADALAEAPSLGAGARRLSASGLLSPSGPGLYGPAHGSARDIAGQGVANPSEMLLAAALLLGEGLGRRAAAQTLEASLAAALRRPLRTPDMPGARMGATTREFVDVVIQLLPSSRSDTEFALGGAA
jgi:3-isopropylmalate dehydrogenase